MIRISSSSTKLVRPLGFSNGIALLTLKKPPPLVPSSLIASCEATGPERQGLRAARRSCVNLRAVEGLDHALGDEHERGDE